MTKTYSMATVVLTCLGLTAALLVGLSIARAKDDPPRQWWRLETDSGPAVYRFDDPDRRVACYAVELTGERTVFSCVEVSRGY